MSVRNFGRLLASSSYLLGSRHSPNLASRSANSGLVFLINRSYRTRLFSHLLGVKPSLVCNRPSCGRILFSVRCASTKPKTQAGEAIQQTTQPLQVKKRPSRKRSLIDATDENKLDFIDGDNAQIIIAQDSWNVIAYATAEEYDLEELSKGLLKQGLYQPTAMPEDVHDVLHVAAKYPVGREPREIYIFREGSMVFWNVPELERQAVLQFVKAYEVTSYDEILVKEENEVLDYTYADIKTRLVNGKILLNSEGSTDLEKYTFSNAMGLSVKLALWEASLDRYVDSIEFVTENMTLGRQIPMTRNQVLKKTGELFTLRHHINLSSDLLDTPDFYWDRENLESLYHKTCNHLNISKRTKVMNEKLSHCSELIQLIGDHLSDQHHTRLELMIIALISVEVLFATIHLIYP